MDKARIEELAEMDQRNFWFRVKQFYVRSLIGKGKPVVLDVGCGTGGNMIGLRERGCRVIGIDRSPEALEHCRRKGIETVRCDLERERLSGLDVVPDVVTALDFIEHLRDPERALREIRSVAGENTRLIVTVPAWQFLWSDWDVSLNHQHRYSKKRLALELERTGWSIERLQFFHLFLFFPAVLVRKILGPLFSRGSSRRLQGGSFINPGAWINELFYASYLPEFLLFRLGIRPPIGLSLLAVARPAKEGPR